MASSESCTHNGTHSAAWRKWKAHTDGLRAALQAVGDGEVAAQKARIAELLTMCMDLYKETFHSSAAHAHRDPNSYALASLAGEFQTSLEVVFMWIGGWRPTSAITLIFSTLGLHAPNQSDSIHQLTAAGYGGGHGSSLQEQHHILSTVNEALLKSKEQAAVSGPAPASSSSSSSSGAILTDEELAAVEGLRRRVLDRELHLTNQLASIQMLLPDQGILEALATRDIKGHVLVESKVSHLALLFSQANELRLETIESLLRLLDPVQSALCCIAAFELLHALKALC